MRQKTAMDSNVFKRVSRNPAISLSKFNTPGVCDVILKLPEIKKRSDLKKSFSLRVANAIMQNCTGTGDLVRQIGEGSYGRVFVDRGDKTAVKLQVFRIKNVSEIKSEIELNQIFGINGIAPRLISYGMFRTDSKQYGGAYIKMDKHEPLDKVLKRSSPQRKAEIMSKIEPQMISILNKMLSLGFACIDLKPQNALLGDGDKLFMIDFTADLCEKAPMLIQLRKQKELTGDVITFKSMLPDLIRKDIIAMQIIFFHCTTKVFTDSYFAVDLIRSVVFSQDQLPIRNSYKMLVLGKVPRVYENFLEDAKINRELNKFLKSLADLGSLNFRHYTRLSRSTSYERYISFLLGRINTKTQ